jgi:hypothetical protein
LKDINKREKTGNLSSNDLHEMEAMLDEVVVVVVVVDEYFLTICQYLCGAKRTSTRTGLQ